MNTLERTAQKGSRELQGWLMRSLRFRLLAAMVGFVMQAIQRDWIYPLQHHYSKIPASNFSVSKNLAMIVLPLKILPSSAFTAYKGVSALFKAVMYMLHTLSADN